jgi:hypothetical protein
MQYPLPQLWQPITALVERKVKGEARFFEEEEEREEENRRS